MRRIQKLLAGLFVGLLVLVGGGGAARAQTLNLTTSPLPINLVAKPGTTVTTDIRIKNDAPQTQHLKVGLLKFTAYGEEGSPALQERQPGDDYFDWVSFSPSVFDAPTGEWQTIKMTVNVPKDAGFSYYYAVTFTPEGKASGPGNVLIGSSAVMVLLDTQNPNAKRSVKIASFSSDKRLYEFLPASFTVKFHNDGNVHVVPHGNIFIKRGNKAVASLVFNGQQGNILPGTNRNYRAVWGDGFPVYETKEVGNKTTQSLTWNFSKANHLRFGRYTAQLVAVYDDGTKDVPLEATVSFWVIPWRIVAIILVLAGLFALGLWTSSRGILKRAKRPRKAGSKDDAASK